MSVFAPLVVSATVKSPVPPVKAVESTAIIDTSRLPRLPVNVMTTGDEFNAPPVPLASPDGTIDNASILDSTVAASAFHAIGAVVSTSPSTIIFKLNVPPVAP